MECDVPPLGTGTVHSIHVPYIDPLVLYIIAITVRVQSVNKIYLTTLRIVTRTLKKGLSTPQAHINCLLGNF